MVSRNRIKYLRSLRIKKFRNENRQFIAEGDKIVRDILADNSRRIRQVLATHDWLEGMHGELADRSDEILEADPRDLEQLTVLESPPPVLAVLDIPDTSLDPGTLRGSWNIALDALQDPGNLGTIIRTADWFGIRHILCNEACADCYNPKVVQASMGALFRVEVHYTDLPPLLETLGSEPDFPVYGTFTRGTPVFEAPRPSRGLLLFGNESRGISGDLLPFIRIRITIPPGNDTERHVESLNVASAVAVVCSVITRK